MSYQGQSPKVNRLRLQPRSADPVNPAEGDLQYADGTARAEGLYVYKNSAWVSVVDSQGQVDKLRFVPQASDPVGPQEGDVFYADGSSRAEGLWLYQNSTWMFLSGNTYQDIAYQKIFHVRLASAALSSYTLANLIPGYSFDGVSLVAGNFILLKSQATNSENGVYVIASAGLPTRHADFNSASQLSFAAIAVDEGSTNTNKCFVQSNKLTLITDTQSWSEVTAAGQAAAINFTVPQGLTELSVIASGGGAGGGGGGNSYFYDTLADGGGSGGGGAAPLTTKIAVTPGETLTVELGGAGRGAAPYATGTVGGDTLIKRSGTVILRLPGATNAGTSVTGIYIGAAAAAAGVSGKYSPLYIIGSESGKGGNGSSGAAQAGGSTTSVYTQATGGNGAANISGTSTGNGGGGGAGGCGFTAGARGGHGGSRSTYGASSVSRSSDVTTVNLTGAAQTTYATTPFVPGDLVRFSGFTPATFNGTWTVLSSTSSSFTVYNPGANVSPSTIGSVWQATPGHNGTYGSGGGGGGGASGDYSGTYDPGKRGGWGGIGFVRFIW